MSCFQLLKSRRPTTPFSCPFQRRALRISGGVENLEVYANFFRFRADEDGAHHHPEYLARPCYIRPGTLSVIIEADTEYIEELRGDSPDV